MEGDLSVNDLAPFLSCDTISDKKPATRIAQPGKIWDCAGRRHRDAPKVGSWPDDGAGVQDDLAAQKGNLDDRTASSSC